MKLDRRGILKGILAAPVAARHVGGQIASAMTSPGLSSGLGGLPAYGVEWDATSGPVTSSKDYLAEHVVSTRSYITKLVSRSLDDREAKNIMHHCRARALQCLDPDLYASRSMSLSAKIHMQTQRNVDDHYARAIEDSKFSLESLVKQLAGLGK